MSGTQKNVGLKVDFNLLMSGTWVLEKKGKQRIHYFEKEVNEGKIVIYNALDVPNPFDSKFLDYLMKISQENEWSQTIYLPSISQIIKDLGLTRKKKSVERIKKSLKILKNTNIEFHNCFIDSGILKHFRQGNWEIITIGIISKYGLERIKSRGNPLAVKVVFDDDFISLCKHSLGYKLIPYAPINGLRDTAYALYKWAWRWYDSKESYGERWIGNGKNLVKWYKNELNSTAKYRYPSKVLERIQSAIKQLNKTPEVPFILTLKKLKDNYKIEIHGKTTCIINGETTSKREIPFDKLPRELRTFIISLIEQKKNIKSPYALARSMSWQELERLLRNYEVIYVPQKTFEELQKLSRTSSKVRDILKCMHVVGKEENKLEAIVEKKFIKNTVFSQFFDLFVPEWKIFKENASKLIKNVKDAIEISNSFF